jgi:hypothetical protein
VSTCPRCGEELGYGQEYCLECGLRVPGAGPLGFAEDPGRGWARRAFVGLVVAVAGAAVAVAATGGTSGDGELLTATGGFATVPARGTVSVPSAGERGKILDWPVGQDGWTIALATLPQAGGKQAAVARARQATDRGLSSVGVLDSSRYASLHPGYWLVFTGIYTSEAEATSALQPARAVARTASVRRIVP